MTHPALLPVHQENTVTARTGRRRDFRLMFRLAPEARGYVPSPYINADPADDYATDGLTQPITPENAERAGATYADPS